MVIIEFILLAIGAYLLGSVPAAYVIAKWRRGMDLRQYGSGNIGASNVLAAVSKRWAIPVTIFDIGKGALTVWIAQLLGLGAAAQVTVGILTIIGHNWPVFLHFKGGRGVFTTLGVTTMLSPWLGLIILVIAYSLAPLRQLALGVLLAYACLPFFSWFLYAPLNINIEGRLAVTLGMVAIALIGIFKRLVAPRTPLSESVPPGQLIVNRVLFDRDIRDRKTWVSRVPPEVNPMEQPLEQQEEQGEV